MRKQSEHPFRIVLTGGPGGGKTTAADLFRRELGEKVVVVPESATMLFSGGFPRSKNTEAREASQLAIYHLQSNLEEVQCHLYPHRILLCDRGTIDGAAYWPDGTDSFFSAVDSTYDKELQRYKAVIFFETAAAGGISIEGGNPTRTEGIEEARLLDSKLRKLWSKHPRFILVPHHKSFLHKINLGIQAIKEVVSAL